MGRQGFWVAVSAGLISTAAGAVNIARDGIGEAAVAPYYTVRDGWLTKFNLTNTRATPIVVKVRFKEHRNGRDVLNFNVALAGHDVFAGVIREADDRSGPVFVTFDQENADGARTCTIPSSVAVPGVQTPFSARAFGPRGTVNDDGGPSGSGPEAIERLREGHVEFIVMGHTVYTDMAATIEGFGCGGLDTAFSQQQAPNGLPHILNTARQFGEPINALRVVYALVNPVRGVEVDGIVTTWANFYNRSGAPRVATISPEENAACSVERSRVDGEGRARWFPGGEAGSCRNLISAQTEYASLEPSLNDAYPAIAWWWNDEGAYPSYSQPTAMTVFDTDGSGLQPSQRRPRGVDALSLTIQSAAIVNEWSSNDALGVSTDWIVTTPTKPFYVDGGASPTDLGPGPYSALSDRREGVRIEDAELPYPPFIRVFGQDSGEEAADPRDTAGSCVLYGYFLHDYYDRTGNEGSYAVVSASSPPRGQICLNASVLAFDERSGLGPKRRQGEFTTGIEELWSPKQSAGWLRLNLSNGPGLEARQIDGPLVGAVESHRGLPVIGFAVKQRSFGSVTSNYASSIPHSYVREAVTVQ